MRLDLGCGLRRREGGDWITVDNNPLVNPDILHDLSKLPYPFNDNSIDEINMGHVLEHLSDPFTVMKELHRILKPGACLRIQVPHFSRGFTHSQHKNSMDVSFPLYFNKNYHGGYYGVDFELKSMRLDWMCMWDLKIYAVKQKWILSILKVINKFISWLANLNPYFCSRIWCYWVGGFEQIEFVFIKK